MSGDRHKYFFFLNDTATPEIYTLSLHDALPICIHHEMGIAGAAPRQPVEGKTTAAAIPDELDHAGQRLLAQLDRKSTRLNSSHANISYAVFCLKKKNNSTFRLIFSIAYIQF